MLTREQIQAAKNWFGQGEYDVNLMIGCSAITEQQIAEMYQREVLIKEETP